MAVERLFLSPAGGQAQVECRQLALLAGRGIVGDRHCGRSDWVGQNLTLVEAEEIEAFCAASGRAIDLSLTRRNIVTRGVRLDALVGRQFRIGEAVLLGVELCEPCGTLGRRLANAAFAAPAVVNYWRGRGGLRAEVLAGGRLACGDLLQPLEAAEDGA